MRKVGSQQDQVVVFKMVNTVADKLPADRFNNIYQFQFGMIMPFIIKKETTSYRTLNECFIFFWNF